MDKSQDTNKLKRKRDENSKEGRAARSHRQEKRAKHTSVIISTKASKRKAGASVVVETFQSQPTAATTVEQVTETAEQRASRKHKRREKRKDKDTTQTVIASSSGHTLSNGPAVTDPIEEDSRRPDIVQPRSQQQDSSHNDKSTSVGGKRSTAQVDVEAPGDESFERSRKHSRLERQDKMAVANGSPDMEDMNVKSAAAKGDVDVRRKRGRKNRRNGIEDNTQPVHEAPIAPEATQLLLETLDDHSGEVHHGRKSERRKRRERKTTRATKEQEVPAWSVSEPVGGRFINAEPLFNPEEKQMIMATESAVHVYSTSDSLLVHSLPAGSNRRISAYTISPIKPEVLYVGTESGHLLKWDFVKGRQLGSWKIGSKIFDVKAAVGVDETADTIFVIDKSKSWQITAHRFGKSEDSTKMDSVTLLTLDKSLHSIKVLERGHVIAAMSTDGFLIGNLPTSPSRGIQLEQLRYTWQDIQCTEPPTCFDLQTSVTEQKSTSKKVPKAHSVVNVVVGGLKGCIFVYEDVLNRSNWPSAQSGKRSETSKPLDAREMHWHREAVGAIAWSMDGNYIISGGREHVLVLWQLSTARKQFLPNLESPIRSVVVSPSGSSYAVRLGDNSLMILSTSELTPTANVVGLQTLSLPSAATSRTTIPTIESSIYHRQDEPANSIASVVDPTNQNRLLVAVPVNQPETEVKPGAVTAPYLQTFDLSISRHVSRQALTRNNATNTNLGPEGNRILEPNVKLMQLSHNSHWLATVDEWAVPQQDVADLIVEHGEVKGAIKRSQDIQLKFWSWNRERREWMLNSRIASPHQESASPDCETILDLAAEPSSISFATLGTDSTVRVWTPKTKLPTGKVVRGERKPSTQSKSGEVDTWWSLDYSVPLPSSTDSELHGRLRPRRAKLAFSNDGTVLAAYQYFSHEEDRPEGTVHFIDVRQGIVKESRSSLYDGVNGIHEFGFLERYLICAGRESVLIWDITTFDLLTRIPLESKASTSEDLTIREDSITQENRPLIHLAINLPSSTFAIAVPEPARHTKRSIINPLANYTTKLYIFSPYTGSERLLEAGLPRATLTLMSVAGIRAFDAAADDNTGESKGYVLLDAGSEVRIIRPQALPGVRSLTDLEVAGSVNLTAQESDDLLNGPGQEDANDLLEVEDFDEDARRADAWAAVLAKQEDDRPVVRPQQLAEVFDYPSHAMPSMKDMFRSVVSLYTGRA